MDKKRHKKIVPRSVSDCESSHERKGAADFVLYEPSEGGLACATTHESSEARCSASPALWHQTSQAPTSASLALWHQTSQAPTSASLALWHQTSQPCRSGGALS